MTVAAAIDELRRRIGAKHGGDPDPDLALAALQSGERQVMSFLPEEARSATTTQSGNLVQAEGADVVAASLFPSDCAIVLTVERDSKPAIKMDLGTMRAIQADKNTYLDGSNDRPYWAVGEAGLVIDPVGKTGDSVVKIDYLAVPSLTLQGSFLVSDQFMESVMDVAEAIVLRKRGPEWYQAATLLMAEVKQRFAG